MKSRKFALLPIFLILLSSTGVPYSYASVESEAQEDILAGCRDGQTMVYRNSYNEYVCVDPDTADRWRELGLAKIISENKEEIKEKNLGYSDVKNEKFPGAPPEPPKKSPSSTDSECRDDYVLVYRFAHLDTFCTSPSTAKTWERLGIAEITNSVKSVVDIAKVADEAVADEAVADEAVADEAVADEAVADDLVTSSDFLYDPKIQQIGDRVWLSVGYDKTNSILIEGDSGIIVIDTLSSYESAKEVIRDFRTLISEKPIKTIIYTQANPDLLLGSQAFVEEGDGNVEIIAPEDILNHFSDNENPAVLPTHTFKSEFLLDISGVKMILVFDIGEFSDQMYIFIPSEDGLLIGDTVYGVAPYILDIKNLLLLNESG